MPAGLWGTRPRGPPFPSKPPMDRRPIFPLSSVPPVDPSAAGNPVATPRTPSLRGFSLYAIPPSETAASLGARRALMSRKSVSVEEVGTRARERRRAASKIERFDRLARLLLMLLVIAGVVAWLGSARDSVPVLLTGYVLLGLSAAALIARVTRTPEAARLPLERYYLPDEQLASAEDITLLRRLAQEDSELDAATAAWWRSTAPIRKGDVRLALEFSHAKRAGSGLAQKR